MMMNGRTTATPKTGVTRSQHSFAQIPGPEVQRSRFDRSCGHRTTFDAAYLVPIFADEALPGDTLHLAATMFARMSTPLWPVMDNMWIDFFFFFVPNRLVWDNWERMNGDQVNPGDSTDFLVPEVAAPVGGAVSQDLYDYLGYPLGVDLNGSALFTRSYSLIWNEWFRDQNLQDRVVVDTDDGPDDPTDYVLLRRGKRHDYFTSCLPFPQKGDPVELPLGTSAPVSATIASTGDGIPTFDADGTTTNLYARGSGGTNLDVADNITNADDLEWQDPKLGLVGATADLSSATAATINEIRQAFQIQKLLERDARGGTRYTEVLRSHFGVVSKDQRLQRPEFLGGGTANINVQAVPATADIGNSVAGTLRSFATASIEGVGFRREFTEHGVILGMAAMRADLTYQQGLEKQFSRRTRYDFYWPALAHLGEQPVLNKEIYAQGDANDDLVFGYQERYAEYRFKPSRVSGRFRSAAPFPLDAWHLAQDFSALPVLGDTFIQEDPPVDRVVRVPSEPNFIMDCWFDYKATRPMPLFSVPGLVDHF